MEWAGAFGDLGTIIPFVVGYISVLKMEPFGILFAFGITMIVCGATYKTPIPVQPMKAIGAVAITQAAQTVLITPAAVYSACLATGIFWLVLGITGAAGKIANLVSRPVVMGIVLGLGMSFMLEGIKMMATRWIIAIVGLAGTLFLLNNRKIPALLLLLLFGVFCGIAINPDSLREIAAVSCNVRAPRFVLLDITWSDLYAGVVFLALPQLPLTLGNAVIGIREENNRLFPDRPVTDKMMATSTGLMNIAGSAIGGIPMCHGAGGMAGHVAFGARTGGALIILGTVLLVLAVFFSNSITTLFGLIPAAILGVILFLAGAQLAIGSSKLGNKRGERIITLMTAAFSIWNIGAAFLIGIAGSYLFRRGYLKL